MSVGQRIRDLRGKMTLKEFAEPLEVTTTTISAIENGKLGLSSDLAVKISKVYNVSTDWLLMGEEKPLAVPEPPEGYVTVSKDELLNLYKRLSQQQEVEIGKLQKQVELAKNIKGAVD